MESASVSKKSCKALLLVAIHREIEPTPTRIPRRKWSQQAGYLNCWPEPRSTGCSILNCTPAGNPTRKPDSGGDQLKRGRFSPESQPTYPKVLEKSLRWKKTNSRIIQAAGGMNIRWDHSQKLAGRSGWWGYVRIVDMVRVARMVRMVRMFSKSSDKVYRNACEYTSWRSWDRCIHFISFHFLNSGNSREESPSTNDHKDPVPEKQRARNHLF